MCPFINIRRIRLWVSYPSMLPKMRIPGLFPNVDTSLMRETQCIVTVYIGNLMSGYAMGFSAVAIPDIMNEMKSNQSSILPAIDAKPEDLSWFGET